MGGAHVLIEAGGASNQWDDTIAALDAYIAPKTPETGTTVVDSAELADLLLAVAEGGWASGEGTSDPNHKGPTLKDAAAVIREFHRFREEIWDADAEKDSSETDLPPDPQWRRSPPDIGPWIDNTRRWVHGSDIAASVIPDGTDPDLWRYLARLGNDDSEAGVAAEIEDAREAADAWLRARGAVLQ
jgi:hypothetical protein